MHKVFKVTHHMALVGLWEIKEELCKFFFQINFPKYLALGAKIMSSNHITHVNYLDEHVVLKKFVHKHQDDKHGIELMQANHRKYVCSAGGVS